MNKQKWILGDNGIYYPIPASTVLHLTPGPGIFKICQGSDPNDKRIGLMRIQEGEKFEFTGKKYSLGTDDFVKRVVDCWNSDSFIENQKNLAIGLTGLKGAGKTYLAKDIANVMDLPILILDNDFEGLVVDFITSLEFECVILIDEAEKIFNRDNQNSHILLRIIDGVSNASRKFYILTTNNMDIDDNFLGRPGRLRYIKKFISLPPETVQEIIDDLLQDKTKLAEVKDIINTLSISTIDIVRSVIEEFNEFGSILDRESFNLPLAPYSFEILTFDDELTYNDLERVTKVISELVPKSSNIYSWLHENSSEPDNEREYAANPKYGNIIKEVMKESDEGYTVNERLLCKALNLNSDGYAASPLTLTASSPVLYRGLETSRGTIMEEPDKNGFFLLRRTNYMDTPITSLCLIVKETGTSYLYNKFV